MVGVVGCEDDGAELIQAESGALQSRPEGFTRVGHAHASIYQGPSIAAYKSMDIEGTQWKRDRQGYFPNTRRNQTGFGKRLIGTRRLHGGRMLHAKSFLLIC